MRRTTSIHLHAPLDLPRICGSLIAAAGTETLLDNLEELLAAGGALPARLYLFDRRAGAYYAVAGFDCGREAADIPLPDDLHPFPDHRVAVRTDHAEVALIEILATEPWDRRRIEQVATVLAPALVAVDRADRAHRELHHLRQEIQQLTVAGGLLRHLDLDVLLTKVLETAMTAVRAEVGVLTASGADGAERRVSWGLRDDHVDAIRELGGGRLVDRVIADGKSRGFDGAAIARELDLSGLDGRLTGLLALPLIAGERTLGVILLGNPDGAFGDAERRLAEAVCGMAAMAIDNALLVLATVDRERMQRELDLAREVQESMWPQPRLVVGGLTAAGASRPCSETGGDYYTYRDRGGRLVVAIGDVSGHGLGAALFTTTAHAILQQQLRAGADVDESARVLNGSLLDANSGRFMTAALVEIDPATRVLRYVSAGHNPLLLANAAGARWLPSCTMPLGIEPTFVCPPPSQHALAAGDLVLLYTDGVTEAFNPDDESFGTARLAVLARELARRRASPEEVVQAVFAAVERWAAGVPWHDDLTLVAVVVG